MAPRGWAAPPLPSSRSAAIVRGMTRRGVHLIAAALALVLSAQVVTATACEMACLLGIGSPATTASDSAADCHAADVPHDGPRLDGSASGCQHAASLNPVPGERVRSGIEMPAPGIATAVQTPGVAFLHEHSFGELTNDPPGSPRVLSLPLRL